MSSDKRQSDHVSTDVRGSWHRGSVHCLTRVANLSTGGCFIESLDQTPPSGQSVSDCSFRETSWCG